MLATPTSSRPCAHSLGPARRPGDDRGQGSLSDDELQTANPNRESALKELKDNPRTQVLIIGGGINGAGVFRDLALQGVDCLLVDKSDWCAATRAAPSRLIHAQALKYLLS